MYIPQSGGEDHTIWEFEKSGTYSVKSGYHLALTIAHTQSASSSSTSDRPSISPHVWKRIWSLSIRSRIQFFVWRLLHNACPTNLALFQRNSCLSPVCLRCGEHKETTSHLFLHCPTSIRLWRASRLGFNFETGAPIPLAKWLQQWIIDAPEDEDLIFSIYILWNMWLERNKFIWEGVQSSLEQILHAVQRMNRKGLPWQEDSQVQQGPYFSACKKPVTIRNLELFFHGLQRNQHNCQLALTIDGSFQATSQICKAAIAWVVEDRTGNLVSQHSIKVHALTALQTEALACLWPLKHYVHRLLPLCAY